MPRPSGSKNKITTDMKPKIKELFEKNFNKFEEELIQLQGKQFIDVYLRLIEFIVPKAKEELIQLNDYKPPKIIIEYTNE